MLKKDAIKKLKERITQLESKPNDYRVYMVADVRELPKCPKCGTYEGKGFSTGSACGYSMMNCKVCNYSYCD